jgi:tRNA pseudouridine55 synthase
LGQTTPSYDLETEVSELIDITHLSEAQIQQAITKFKGKIMQLPPAHSAIKVGGKRAYEFARQGKEVELKPREIEIREFEITSLDLPRVNFRVICSKGTYIRSLARDVGAALGVGAYLSELCRTRIGEFKLANAQTIEEISNEDLSRH